MSSFKQLYSDEKIYKNHVDSIGKLTNVKLIKGLLESKVEDFKMLREIKNKYWDMYKMWFKK